MKRDARKGTLTVLVRNMSNAARALFRITIQDQHVAPTPVVDFWNSLRSLFVT